MVWPIVDSAEVLMVVDPAQTGKKYVEPGSDGRAASAAESWAAIRALYSPAYLAFVESATLTESATRRRVF